MKVLWIKKCSSSSENYSFVLLPRCAKLNVENAPSLVVDSPTPPPPPNRNCAQRPLAVSKVIAVYLFYLLNQVLKPFQSRLFKVVGGAEKVNDMLGAF